MTVATVILAFGVLVLVAHATSVSRQDAARVRRTAEALAALGARATRLDARTVSRRLAGCHWLALGHDLSVWNAVDCTAARGNLTIFCATVDAGARPSKLRRRWAVACFTATRDLGHALALREPRLPLDGLSDYRAHPSTKGVFVAPPQRHTATPIEGMREMFEAADDLRIEFRGHLVVVWRPLRRVVDDCAAVGRAAATFQERIEGAARPVRELVHA